MFSEETRKKIHAALAGQIKDVVVNATDEADFRKRIDKLKAAKDNSIEGAIPATLEVIRQKYGFNEDEKDTILKHLITGADLSQYGLANAITRTASDIEDYDRATLFERTGGKVIELNGAAWDVINREAA